MTDLLRVYFDPAEIGEDGYPHAWGKGIADIANFQPAIKDLIRERDGHRCLRCGHPYTAGNPRNSARSQWSPCDDHCTHGDTDTRFIVAGATMGYVEAEWRILTVHHLNGIKHDCRWWNLVSLCQRCHLRIQTRVEMKRIWPWEHTPWFRPFAAGWYAWTYLGQELTREQVDERLDELLALERIA